MVANALHITGDSNSSQARAAAEGLTADCGQAREILQFVERSYLGLSKEGRSQVGNTGGFYLVEIAIDWGTPFHCGEHFIAAAFVEGFRLR